MKEFLLHILKGLADHPDEIEIESGMKDEITYHLKVTCNKSDIGKFIGKKGKTAEAIRTLLVASAGKERKKIFVEFPK